MSNQPHQQQQQQELKMILKFVPFSSAIESAFWVRYCRDKLETIHLNEQPIPIRLTYGVGNHSSSSSSSGPTTSSSNISTQTPPRLQCHDRSLLLQQQQQQQQQEQQNASSVSSTLDNTTNSTTLPPPPSSKSSTTFDDTTRTTTTSTIWTNNECVYVHGDMIGYNTFESFQKVDKNQLLYDYFVQRFFPNNSNSSTDTTNSSSCSSNNTLDQQHITDLNIVQSLNCVLLISYADLKSHSVVYWFGIPVLVPQSSIHATTVCVVDSTTNSLLDSLHEGFHAMRRRHHLLQQSPKQLLSTTSTSLQDGGSGLPPYFIFYYSNNSNDDDTKNTTTTKCLPLCMASYRTICTECDNDVKNIYFSFVDPLFADVVAVSNNNSDEKQTNAKSESIPPHMGWPMRNMIAYLSIYLNLGGRQDVNIISYRSKVIRRIDTLDDMDDDAKRSTTTTAANDDEDDDYGSVVMTVRIPTKEEYHWNTTDKATTTATTATSVAAAAAPAPVLYKVVGWELNARYKPGPRSVNLRPLLDTNHLAIQAADLNLKLMKWRMIPNLQVELLQSTKVLLIGAGTLGCNVARVLLGWGIRNIKILDYGKVSYSNPVRQSLFTIHDCNADNGTGRMKAIAAAGALKTIAADVVSEGIVLSIPMPGHPDKEDVIGHAVKMLDSLIQEADVVYLLTDTRESRWLPTVMCSAYNKILINAALGLDSWLVMRHGAASNKDHSETAGDDDVVEQSTNNNSYRLGCYFCSDVVAPENSTKNRTLDQQCTVTRPGLALIASSMAVELMVSLLHHPKRISAPAPKNSNSHTNTQYSPTISSNDTDIAAASSALGIIPHSIRGSLVSYTMMTPTIPAFQYCTGCSKNVTDAYLNDKMNFVQQSCRTTDGSYLEEISGLTAFRLAAAEKLVDMEGWEDDE